MEPPASANDCPQETVQPQETVELLPGLPASRQLAAALDNWIALQPGSAKPSRLEAVCFILKTWLSNQGVLSDFST